MPLKYEKPSESLLSELKEVKADALNLVEALQSENRPLPNTFPRKQLISYAEVMSELVDGTAEGCREPLIFARNELTRIRRKNILNTDQADEADSNLGYDAPPPIRRGDNLDRALRTLISSVSTALDEYRAQASEEPENDLVEEPSTDIPDNADIKSAKEQSEELENELDEAIEAFPDSLSENEETFARVLEDTHSQNKLVRTVLIGPKYVKRWASSLITELRRKPKIIRDSHDLLSLGATSALFLSAFNPKLMAITAILGTLARTLTVIERRYLNGETSGNGNDDNAEENETPPHITPSDEKAAVIQAKRLLGQSKPVPDEIAHKVREINLYNVRFQDTKLLANFIWLHELHVHRKNIVDWSGLRHLKHLKILNAAYSSITKLEQIESLTKLKKLNLGHTRVTNVSVLAKLTELKELQLNNSSIRDLTGISKLEKLQKLNLKKTSLNSSAMHDIESLTNLTNLNLSSTRINDKIGPSLANLINIKSLDLSWTQISDKTGAHLIKLTNLSSLDLSGTKVSSEIGYHFSELNNLTILSLESTNVNDNIGFYLKELPKLRFLDLDGTSISDEFGRYVVNFPQQMLGLYINRTSVTNAILPHLYKSNLRKVQISGTKIESTDIRSNNFSPRIYF